MSCGQNLRRQDEELRHDDGGAEHPEAVLELDEPEDAPAAGLAGDAEVPAHVGGQREAEGEADGTGGRQRILVNLQQLHRVVVRCPTLYGCVAAPHVSSSMLRFYTALRMHFIALMQKRTGPFIRGETLSPLPEALALSLSCSLSDVGRPFFGP